MIGLFSHFQGFSVNNIKCVNDGDVAQFFVCKELIEKKIPPHNGTANSVYVDIGAYVGAWTSMINTITNSTAEIHAYEPGKQHYKLLEENCGNYQNVHLNNYGIGETETDIRIVYTGGGGHFQTPLDDLSVFTNNEMVKAKPFKNLGPIHIMKIDVDGYECKLLPTLYPFLYLIHSLICEMDVYDYSANRDECIAITTPILEKLISQFPYTYGLSRRGAPFCVEIKMENIKDWIEEHYDNHLSTDLLFTHHKIGSITCVKYVKNMYYA
jgi:FkbM family methyltransferase